MGVVFYVRERLTVSKQQLCCVFTARSKLRPPGGSTKNPTDTRHSLITKHINPSIQLKTELPRRRSLKSNDPNVTVIVLIQRSEWNFSFCMLLWARETVDLHGIPGVVFMGFHWVERFHYSTHKLPARLRLLFLTGAQFRPDVDRPVNLLIYLFICALTPLKMTRRASWKL